MRFHIDRIYDDRRPSRLDAFTPRCRVLCAAALTIPLASARSLPELLTGSVIPFLLLFAGDFAGLWRSLAHINAVTFFAWILLPLTTPGPQISGVLPIFSESGVRMALLLTCKLNLISVTLIRMVAELGIGRIDGVLNEFRFPEKMRVLLLLTLRYALLLMDRVSAMTRAIRLRAPKLGGKRLCRAFACMLGTTLIHSSDRAERSMLAMRCRGGIAGFSQYRPGNWRLRDTLLCVFFAVNAALLVLSGL
jgi:energy-coupling factor transporter transmembrane protein EcfT